MEVMQNQKAESESDMRIRRESHTDEIELGSYREAAIRGKCRTTISASIQGKAPVRVNLHDASMAFQKLQVMIKPWAREIIPALDENREMSGTELLVYLNKVAEFRCDQSEVSRFVNTMMKVGILGCRRNWKWKYYYLQYDEIERIMKVSKVLSKMYNR